VKFTIVWGFMQQFNPISSGRLMLSAHSPSKQNKRYIFLSMSCTAQGTTSWSAEQGIEKMYLNLMDLVLL